MNLDWVHLNSELNDNFDFKKGTVALARKDELNTEDSEFFIILKEIPFTKVNTRQLEK